MVPTLAIVYKKPEKDVLKGLIQLVQLETWRLAVQSKKFHVFSLKTHASSVDSENPVEESLKVFSSDFVLLIDLLKKGDYQMKLSLWNVRTQEKLQSNKIKFSKKEFPKIWDYTLEKFNELILAGLSPMASKKKPYYRITDKNELINLCEKLSDKTDFFIKPSENYKSLSKKVLTEGNKDFIPILLMRAEGMKAEITTAKKLDLQKIERLENQIIQILKLDPSCGQAWFLRTWLEFSIQQDWRETIDQIKLAKGFMADSFDIHQLLTSFCLCLNKNKAALEEVYESQNYCGDDQLLANHEIEILINLGEFESVEKHLRSLDRTQPASLERSILWLKLSLAKVNEIRFKSIYQRIITNFGSKAFKEPNKQFVLLIADQLFKPQNLYADWNIEKGTSWMVSEWSNQKRIPYFLSDILLKNVPDLHYTVKRLSKRIIPTMEIPFFNYIVLNTDLKTSRFIDLKSLLYIEAEDNYTCFYFDHFTGMRVIRLRCRLTKVDQQLPSDQFVKIHRGLIINLSHKINMEGNSKTRVVRLLDYHLEFPVSRSIPANQLLKLEEASKEGHSLF